MNIDNAIDDIVLLVQRDGQPLKGLGIRDKKGFWRPNKKLDYGPVLVWPFKVWTFLFKCFSNKIKNCKIY